MPPRAPHSSLPRRRLQATLVFPATNFEGGLNLMADAFALADNESPDCLNVDFGVRGGFRQRGAVTAMNPTLGPAVARSIGKWGKAGSSDVIVIQSGTSSRVDKSSGGDFTQVTTDNLAVTGIFRWANMNDLLLACRNAEQVAIGWDGAAASFTALGTAFNDTLSSPATTLATGNMPKAKYIATHGGYTWIANTSEGGVTKGNRVRFSFPGSGINWRTNDYIDIDLGADGDQITGIAPLQDRLLVFKQNSCYAITGFDPQTFAVVPISHEIGAVGQDAIIANENVVWFFSWPQGVFSYNGHALSNHFRALKPLIDQSTIPAGNMTAITLGWLNQRLWVGVPTGASATPNYTYVFDPQLNKNQGGWTKYDIPSGPMLEWKTSGAATRFLVCHPTLARVLKVENLNGQDNYGTGNVNITSYYVTSWFDPHGPSVLKRWKRADFVLDADNSGTFSVDVHVDYDPTTVKKTFSFSVTALGTGMVWDDGTHAANMKWGSPNKWTGAASSGRQNVYKAPTIASRSRSVQLKIRPITATSAIYSINSVSFKYMPKRVR